MKLDRLLSIIRDTEVFKWTEITEYEEHIELSLSNGLGVKISRNPIYPNKYIITRFKPNAKGEIVYGAPREILNDYVTIDYIIKALKLDEL